MDRLYEVAKEKAGITTPSELARVLNVSQQSVNNWEKRGISRQGLLLAQEHFGVSALWIERGIGERDQVIAANENESPPPGYLATDELTELLTLFGGCDEAGRASILAVARAQFDETKLTRAANKRKRGT